MKKSDAIAHAGSVANLAALLEITPDAIRQWGPLVPERRQWAIRVKRPEWFDNRGRMKRVRS